jgi:hypothetical protein
MVRVAGAWTSSTAVLGRWPAHRFVGSRQGLCSAHWPRWQFGTLLVGWVGVTGLAGGRTEVRPASQTAQFRSRRRDEVATTGLPAGERAQARVLNEDQHCRRGRARTLGRTEHPRESERRFGQRARPATRGGRDRRRLFCRSRRGRSEICSATGSLGLHIVTILERSALAGPASLEDPVRGFLLASWRGR